MDDGEPEVLRLRGIVEDDRLAGKQNGATVGRIHTREDLDQGALARTVLADQSMHFAGRELERDVVQDLDITEAFGDSAELDEGRGGRHRPSPSLSSHTGNEAKN